MTVTAMIPHTYTHACARTHTASGNCQDEKQIVDIGDTIHTTKKSWTSPLHPGSVWSGAVSIETKQKGPELTQPGQSGWRDGCPKSGDPSQWSPNLPGGQDHPGAF